MSTNNPNIQLVFRAPANRGFVQGFAGLAESRPACSASGTVELRTAKPIKAAWLKMTLIKVEKLPLQAAGGASYTSDVNGPFTLWEAQGDWALLETRDIEFDIPVPLDVPPSTELHYDAGHGAGIWYRLEVTMLEKGKKKGLLRKETIPLSKWRQNIDIMTHDCHPTWPIHQIPETLYLMTPNLQIHLTRPASAYGPGDIIQLPITLLLAPSSDRPQIQISLIQLSLYETSLFRSSEVESSYPKESFRLVGQRPALVSQSRLEVRGETLRGGEGGGRSWGLMLRIPQAGPGGIGYTVRGGKHLEVKYEIKVEIFGGVSGDELLGVVEKLPVIIDWMSTQESQEEVNKIGYVAALCPNSGPSSLAAPDAKSHMSSPSPPYPSPPISSHAISYASPPQSPPVMPQSISPSPPHSPVPYNAARQHQPMGMDRLLAIGTTPSSRASSDAGQDAAVEYDLPGGWSKDTLPGPGGTRRPGSQGAVSRPSSGESANRPATFGATPRPTLSNASSSSVPGQSQQNRLSFLVHNPSMSVRQSAGTDGGSRSDQPTPPLDLTARAPAYSSAPPASSLGAIQEAMSPSTSTNTIGNGRPSAPPATPATQQFPSAEQEKAQMFARAQAAVGRTQSDAYGSSSTLTPPPIAQGSAAPQVASSDASRPSSAVQPPAAQKWETAEEEKRRLFEMANYKVAVTQALAAGLAPPPLPAALLVKPSQPPVVPPSSPSQPSSVQSGRIPSSTTASTKPSHQESAYESAEQEKARLFQEAQARMSRAQARSEPTSSSAHAIASNDVAAGSSSGAIQSGATAQVYESAEQERARLFKEAQDRVARSQGRSVSLSSGPSAFNVTHGAGPSSSSSSAGTQGFSASGDARPAYESAEAEKARLGAQRDKLAYDEAVARVARTQAEAGRTSSPTVEHDQAAEQERLRRADLAARASRPPPTSRLSIHQPNGHRSVSTPTHRMSLSLHSPPPPASLSGHDSFSRVSSPPPHLPPSSFPSSFNAASSSSISTSPVPNGPSGSAPSRQPSQASTSYPSADEEKARMRYQDAVAARDRVASGSSSGSGPARVASPSIQPTIEEDPIPYDALYGPAAGASSSSLGAVGPSAAAGSSSSSTGRPAAVPPAGAGPPDEKEQMRRFYLAQAAVAARTSATSPSPHIQSSPTFSPPPPPSSFVSEPQTLSQAEQNALSAQREAAGTPFSASTASPPLSRDPTISMGKQRAPPPSRPASSIGHGYEPSHAGRGSGGGTGSVASAGVPTKKAGGGPPPPLPPKPPTEYAARYVNLGSGGSGVGMNGIAGPTRGGSGSSD